VRPAPRTGAWHDIEPLLAGKRVEGAPVELQYGIVIAADDQQGRSADVRKRATRQVWPSTAGDDSGDILRQVGGGDEGSGCTRTRPKQPDGKAGQHRI
jgi:hypothetical protein